MLKLKQSKLITMNNWKDSRCDDFWDELTESAGGVSTSPGQQTNLVTR